MRISRKDQYNSLHCAFIVSDQRIMNNILGMILFTEVLRCITVIFVDIGLLLFRYIDFLSFHNSLVDLEII